MRKLIVAVVFGGRSVEHDVSIITGNEIISNINKEKYEIVPIYISREGIWYTGDELLDLKNAVQIEKIISRLQKVYISPVPSEGWIKKVTKGINLFSNDEAYKIDVLIPALHGLNGEDGTIQGLLELANIPYVGSGVLGSSVGMDKIVMKSVFKGHDLPILNYTWFIRKDWEQNKDEVLKNITEKLDFPMFVKPANLGSSIGISKAKNTDELIEAIEIATMYDRRIIVEQGIDSPIEVNCAVLGIDDRVRPSVCEQPVSWEEFLSYEDKYLRWSGSKGGSKTVGAKGTTKGVSSKIPADISEDLSSTIKEIAVKAFKALDCKGVSRIDFLIDKETNVYINEINTLPGSLSYYLWVNEGLAFSQLIDDLIEIAIENNKEKNKNIYKYDNDLLNTIKDSLEKK